MSLAARQVDHHTGDGESRLLAEIAFFEARIAQIGGDGDCAYEKALVRQYRQLIAERRRQLRSTRR